MRCQMSLVDGFLTLDSHSKYLLVGQILYPLNFRAQLLHWRAADGEIMIIFIEMKPLKYRSEIAGGHNCQTVGR